MQIKFLCGPIHTCLIKITLEKVVEWYPDWLGPAHPFPILVSMCQQRGNIHLD